MKNQVLSLTDYHTDETFDFACKKYLESRGYFVAPKESDGFVNLDRLPMTYLKVWNNGKKELHYVIGVSGEKFVSISQEQLWKNAKVPSKKKIVEKFSELGIDIEK